MGSYCTEGTPKCSYIVLESFIHKINAFSVFSYFLIIGLEISSAAVLFAIVLSCNLLSTSYRCWICLVSYPSCCANVLNYLCSAYRALYILNWIYRYFTEPHYVHWTRMLLFLSLLHTHFISLAFFCFCYYIEVRPDVLMVIECMHIVLVVMFKQI
jgi:hypothetical protein